MELNGFAERLAHVRQRFISRLEGKTRAARIAGDRRERAPGVLFQYAVSRASGFVGGVCFAAPRGRRERGYALYTKTILNACLHQSATMRKLDIGRNSAAPPGADMALLDIVMPEDASAAGGNRVLASTV